MERPIRVLVTGCAGFIGSHVCEALIARGDTVVGLDAFTDDYRRAFKEANLRALEGHARWRLVEGDACDAEVVRGALLVDGEPVDAVFHAAARAGVRPSIADPAAYVQCNVVATATVLRAMAEVGCDRLVLASSSSVYGEVSKAGGPAGPARDTGHPVSPYAATKRAAELLAHAAHVNHGIGVWALRFFTVYGPRQRPNMAFHKFARIWRSGEAITLYGDGHTSRDYTYVGDVASAVLAALDRPTSWTVVDVGGDRPVPLVEAVTALADALGTPLRTRYDGMQAGDVFHTRADPTQLQDALGLRAETPLDEGLRAFARWYVEHAHLDD